MGCRYTVLGRFVYVMIVLVVGMMMFTVGYAVNDVDTAPRYGYSHELSLGTHQDRVPQDAIKVYKEQVVLDIPGVKYAPISGTNSMLPMLHEGAHSLELPVSDLNSLSEGDVISFYQPDMGRVIIHSIIETGVDDAGWFAVTKGVNNDNADPWKVRGSWIHGVLVGILY